MKRMAALMMFVLMTAGMAVAGDVTVLETGSGNAIEYHLKNTSRLNAYHVDVEVTKMTAETGQVLSKRTIRRTVRPLEDYLLGPKSDQSFEMRYRIIKADKAIAPAPVKRTRIPFVR
jgi:hypothetical protein